MEVEVLSRSFFTYDQQSVKEHNDQGSEVIFQASHAYSSKLAYTQHGRIFLIGGAKTRDATEVVADTVEVVAHSSGKRVAVAKAPMEQARTGFGAVIDMAGERVYVAGGTVGKHKPTSKAEMYDVPSNKWISLPNLTEAKFSQSMSLLNEEYLYSFGGFDEKQKPSTMVERLNIKNLQ